MTKLTTERLEKLQDDLLQFQDSYSDPADKENYDIFVDALHVIDEFKIAKEKILAYEQAAKNPADLKTLVISEIVDFYAGFESPGEPETVDETQSQLIKRVENVFGLAAPVLPKQPEHSRQHFESLCNQFWNWAELDEIDQDEEPRLEWNGSNYTHRVTAALWKMYQAAPTQPALVEKLKKVMNSWLAMEPKLAFQPEFTDVMMLLDAEAAHAQPVIPDNDDDDLIQRLSGRAKFLRDKGEIKTPELIEAAISALSAQPVRLAYKLPDVLDYDCEFEEGDYDIDEEPWLRGRVDGFNEALQIIKRSLNAKQNSTAQESE